MSTVSEVTVAGPLDGYLLTCHALRMVRLSVSWPQFSTCVALAATGAVGLLAVNAPVAQSHHGPDSMFTTPLVPGPCFDGTLTNSTLCQTDNELLAVYIQSSIPATPVAYRQGIYATLNLSYDTTDLIVSYPSTPVYSGSGETDIIYQSATIPGTATGRAWCNDAVSTLRCDQHYVTVEDNSPSKELACHETGHAVGLTHPQEANPPQPQGDPAFNCLASFGEFLGSHNVSMINAAYP